MHALAHLSYPYLIANIVAIALGNPIPVEFNLVILLFSWFPDIDYIYDALIQLIENKKYKIPQTHHQSATHWPIVYTPLIVICVLTGNLFFITATIAIYVHLFMDTLFDNQGIMLFYPFSKKYYIYFSKNTKGKNGLSWNKAYSKLWISHADKIAFLLVILHIFVINIASF